MDKTKNFAEKYATMTSLGNFQDVGENGATPQDSFQEGFCKVIEPSTWKLGFSITAEMMEDNKIGDISNAAKRFTKLRQNERDSSAQHCFPTDTTQK